MSFTLSNLKPALGSRTKIRRIGRGAGSGRGTTAGKGTKGQRARSGGRRGLKRIGLKRIMQRIPKHRGFTSIYPKPYTVNVELLERRFESGSTVTPKKLVALNVIQNERRGVKILGDGVLKKALTIQDCLVSASARAKIEKAGGKVE